MIFSCLSFYSSTIVFFFNINILLLLLFSPFLQSGLLQDGLLQVQEIFLRL